MFNNLILTLLFLIQVNTKNSREQVYTIYYCRKQNNFIFKKSTLVVYYKAIINDCPFDLPACQSTIDDELWHLTLYSFELN